MPSDSAQKRRKGDPMDQKLAKRGGLCAEYLRALNALTKKVTFMVYSSTFYEHDCDVAWVKQLYRVAQTTGRGNKIWYRFLELILPLRRMYVRKLCLLDNLVAMTYLEAYAEEIKRRYERVLHAVAGNGPEENDLRAKMTYGIQRCSDNLAMLAQVKAQMLETFFVDGDDATERLSDENGKRRKAYRSPVAIYEQMSNNGYDTGAFGHEVAGLTLKRC